MSETAPDRAGDGSRGAAFVSVTEKTDGVNRRALASFEADRF
jgi:hypothetical protein